jgi:predicted amidohydrolase
LKVPVVVAQVPVTWDIGQNLAAITAVLAGTRPGEVVVLPEACVSGYDDRLSALDHLDRKAVASALDGLAELAAGKGLHLFCGSLLYEHGAWWNAALYLSPGGTRWTYRKVNLATHERGRLGAGDDLPALRLDLDGRSVTVGVQLCREVLFPEQWQQFADSGAQVFVYLTHAANPDVPAGVWRSHLISHAAANQRFVIAANVADPRQHCPSAIISPRGEVLGELPAGQATILRTLIDTSEVANWYLGQRRTDLLHLHYRGDARADGPACHVRAPRPHRPLAR